MKFFIPATLLILGVAFPSTCRAASDTRDLQGARPQSPINDACQEQTLSLEENSSLRSAFLEIEVDISAQTVNDTTSELVEYQTSEEYRDMCQSSGGTFVGIALRAVCNTTRIVSSCVGFICTTREQTLEVDMVVMNRPRCYGAACAASNNIGLFQEYTLRETEQLWKSQVSATNWVREGDLIGCSAESFALSETEALKWISRDIVPEIQPKQCTILFWDISVEGEQVVLFPGETAETVLYEETCMNSDGQYIVAEDFALRCEQVRVGGGTRVDKTRQFDVVGLPVCLSISCTTPEDIDAFAVWLGVERLQRVEQALSSSTEFEWRCVSEAFALAPLIRSFIAAVAGVWLLW